MEAKLDCYSCYLRIGLQSARMAGATEALQHTLMKQFLELLQNATVHDSPMAMAHRMQSLVSQATGVKDPYWEAKEKCNAEAEQWLPQLKAEVAQSSDPLSTALKIAAIGNIMDYGVSSEFDIHSLLKRIEASEFAVNATAGFRQQLSHAHSLAYITDNAGEIVFDSVLVEHLLQQSPIDTLRLIIRETPFLNDVSDDIHIPESIRSHPKIEILRLSVVPAERNPEVWQALTTSDIVISKGMANFENYSEQSDFFFLLIAKCPLVSQLIAERNETVVKTGDWIFQHLASEAK
jgi:uncharacterized protein with ATP-grasp and redox domains